MTSEIVVVFGTRPEAIKLGPVVHELRRLGVEPRLVCTGQHWDLLKGTPAETDLKGAESLELASTGDVPRWRRFAHQELTAALAGRDHQLVVAQGDTMSVVAAAEAAKTLDIAFAHVEAGLRSHTLEDPWPEEGNRVQITQWADWHYAPTSTAFVNLVNEGIPQRAIVVTGNPVVSAMARYAKYTNPVAEPEDRILITLHRREVQNERMANALYGAVRHMALSHRRVSFLWPLHPAFARFVNRLGEPGNLNVCPPLDYKDMLRVLSRSRGVITDSGGLVEEAATLGVPTICLRNTNDRPEAEEVGICMRFAPGPSGIFAGTKILLDGDIKRIPTHVFGEPDAARLIAEHMARQIR